MSDNNSKLQRLNELKQQRELIDLEIESLITNSATFKKAPWNLELLTAIFKAVPVHIALLDRNGKILHVNNHWIEFGKANGLNSPNFGVGENYLEICRQAKGDSSEEANTTADGIEGVLNGSLPIFQLEYPCHSPDRLRWFRLMVNPVHIKGERSAVVLHSDITERKLVEIKVHSQASLLNEVQDAVMTVNLQNEIIYANPRATELYQWPPEEILGKNAASFFFINPEDDKFPSILEHLLKTNQWSGELTHKNKSGNTISVAARWSLVRDDHGNPYQILKVHTDMSLFSQLLRSQRMNSIGAMAGGIAHDLNNILSPIVLLTESLHSQVPAGSKPILENIENLALKASRLIQQLLGFTRGVEGIRRAELVQEIIHELVAMAAVGKPEALTLLTEIEQDLPLLICNRVQMHQVLLNLYLNAKDAMPNGGVIKISVSHKDVIAGTACFLGVANPGPYVCFTVSDSGMGMSSQDLQRAFEPFFTTKEVGKGTGLGLSTTLGIVKGHRGFIDAESTLGKGTSISINIPAFTEEAAAEKTPQKNAATSTKQKSILVIEDGAELRNVINNILLKDNFKVTLASDGDEALALILNSDEPFDLFFTDLNMPGMAALEFITHLQKLHPNTPILASSGRGKSHSAYANIVDRITLFLEKPYTTSQLTEAVARALGSEQGE